MTACNLWLQPHAGHLVTDGAMYDSDGVIHWIASKVVVADAARMAIGFLGTVDQERIAAALQQRRDNFGHSQEVALQSLVPIAMDLRLENTARSPELEAQGLNGFALVAVTWDALIGHPRGWIVQTEDAPHQMADPWTLHETFGYTTPDVPTPIDMACGHLSGIQHGLEVLEAQRRQPQHGQHIVGGFGEVTTVTADGVRKVRLVDWPDKIGERITP